MIANHLNSGPRPKQGIFPQRGKVTGVFAADHPQNPTGALTLYQVELYMSAPTRHTVGLGYLIPAKGQLGGGVIEKEHPYLTGQLVIVNFIGGDPNQAYIDGVYPDLEHTEVAQSQAEHPRSRQRLSGMELTIDKDGEATLALAAGQALVIVDANGDELARFEDGQGGYAVFLGDSASAEALLTAGAVSLLENHFHPASGGATGTPLVPGPTVPIPMTLGGKTTTKVKAE